MAPLLITGPLFAADIDVSSARTTPITTSNIDGGGPGNVNVGTAGSINVGDATAITINSSNIVTNAGTITTTAESGASAIGAFTGTLSPINITSAITNNGTINTQGPATGSSLANVDVLNAGIKISGLGTFTGNIANTSAINVAGQTSSGIWVNAPMVGNITNSGTITMYSINNTGLMVTGPVTGNITNSGTINAPNRGGGGIYVGNTVTGTLLHSSTISVGTPPTADQANADPVTGIAPTIPEVPSTAGMWIAGNINQGILLAGNGATRAQESLDPSLTSNPDSSVNAYGSGPGILIAPGGAGGFKNVLIGQRTDTPYGLVSNGNIIAIAAADGEAATGIAIRGASNNGTNYTAALSGGFYNAGGNVNVTAINGAAYGVRVGAGGTMPELRNTGDILVSTIDSTADNNRGLIGTKGGTAYGVLIDAGGTLNTFTNYGNLAAVSQGPNSSYGVVDNSGTLSTFYNAGKITPVIDKLSTGTIVAVDLSKNTTGVTFTNEANGIITGPVFLGTGTNRFTMNTAQQNGNVSFVGGNNTLNINTSTLNGNISLGANTTSAISLVNSTLNGGVTFGTGTVNFSATQRSNIVIPDSMPLKVTNLTLDGTSKIAMNLNATNPAAGGVIVAAGNVNIANGALITPVFTGIVANPLTFNLITSGSLTLGAPISSLFAQNTSYMNLYTIGLSPTNANNVVLNVRRRTTGEIGLDPNMSALYNGMVGALQKDTGVSTALSTQTTREGFVSALRQLMPDVTDASRQAALAAQDTTLGAIRRRLTGIPDTRAGQSGDRSSIWFQAIGTGADAKQQGDELGYGFWSIGVALGTDFSLGRTTKVGVSVAELFTSVSYGASANSPRFIYATQVNAYARQDIGPFYVQGIVGGAYNDYRETRVVQIDTFKRSVLGKGDGYQYGGTLEAGTKIAMGKMMLEPYLRASYLDLKRNTFTQTGGGDGLNLIVDPNKQISTRGSVGVDLERDFTLHYDSMLETDFRASYTREFRNNPSSFTSRFAADPRTTMVNTVLPHGPSYYSVGFGVGHKDSFSSVTLDYDAQFAKGFMGHSATVSLRFRF